MDHLLLRSKRFVYYANSTCGYIAFCSPELHQWDLKLNTSLADDYRCSKLGIILSIAINISLSVLIMIGNAAIICIMINSRKFYNAQAIFKVSLAIFDFLVGAVIIPSTIYNEISILLFPLNESYLSYLDDFSGSTVSNVFGILFSVCISGSLFSLLSLTVDRFMAVHWPLRYSQDRLMTRKRAIITVIVVWLLSITLGLLGTGDKVRFHYDLDYMTLNYMLEIKLNPMKTPPDLQHGIFFLVMVFIVPYICVVVVTVITWFGFWWKGHKRKIPKISMAVTNVRSRAASSTDQVISSVTGNNKSASARQSQDVVLSSRVDRVRTLQNVANKEIEKLTKVIVIMVVVFSICVLPFLAVQADSITPYHDELELITRTGRRLGHGCNPILYTVVLELLYLNSLCNFIIYNLRNETFRSELKKTLRTMKRFAIRNEL